MRSLILLHSTTGNTRLVARYAARRLSGLGLDCQILDIHRQQVPDLDRVDLLGVAFPVMYFRPTITIEKVLARLRAPRPGVPAFVLSTAAGDPGAALHLACEQLESAGYAPLGAHWVFAPSNFPHHFGPLEKLRTLPLLGSLHRRGTPPARRIWERSLRLRQAAGMAWLEACEPVEADRAALDRFLEGLVRAARSVAEGAAPSPPDLDAASIDLLVRAGRSFHPSQFVERLGFGSDQARCDRCGICISLCPSHCICEDHEGFPRFGPGCSGCFACYNNCPRDAISSWIVPASLGRYAGPPREMRRLFSAVT